MNFRDFYHATQNRLQDAIMSLWVTGDPAMQQYFYSILNQERLMAEPIFQTAFPWQPANRSFAEVNDIFDDRFIDALNAVKNEEYRFPKERSPYKHQIESWDALINQRKSIAVTTGTGSGKTECFMLPVLYDIYRNRRNTTGINALFLYPLNALIGSQKKRMDAWCRALSGITYAVYNRHTDENRPSDADKRMPELVSRPQIRENPPNILFTNPSMLEYMLVRNKDVQLLKNSKGSLRWILLDEAHTLTGSTAAEMALLIRRIVDAFDVDIQNLRFAITSATVGSGEKSEKQLKDFMANLCGITQDSIKVITGRRVLSQKLDLPKHALGQPSKLQNSATPEAFEEVQKLREDILREAALSLSDIGSRFGLHHIDDELALVDHLSMRTVDGKSILPVRGHFFVRGIGGVFVCSNPECTIHKDKRPPDALGTMTTFAGRICKCGGQLLELVACRSCGNQLLNGERWIDRRTGDETIRLPSAIMQDPFAIDNPDEEDEGELQSTGNSFSFTRNSSKVKFIDGAAHFSISKEGKVINGGESFVEVDNGSSCPHCGESTSDPMHFRLSASFINRVLADIILETTPEAERQTGEMLWKGHKYISFTDSRQGTAKIAALINQDNEANWIRSQVYHKLCEGKKEWQEQNPNISHEDRSEIIRQLEKELEETSIPLLKAMKRRDIEELKARLNSPEVSNNTTSLSWENLRNYLNSLSDLRTLFDGNNPNDTNPSAKSHYLTAILYDQFARRLPRERSIENLGMVSLVYPKLQNAKMPTSIERLSITQDEWKSLLKVALDYVIRYSFHFFVNDEIYPYTTAFIRSQAIFSPEAPQVNVKKWPKFERKKQQNRLALLICAGLGFHEIDDIDADMEDRINEIMEALWRAVKSVLTPDGEGFKLNIEKETQFQLSQVLWLCPVKKRLIDSHFRGYSPWIKGNLTEDNIRHYKIEQTIRFPEFPYPFNIDEEKNSSLERTRRWISEHASPLRKQGVWNNLHEQIILHRPLYLSGEHSAQQSERRLKELEDKFEKSEVNILNCSTTMEMGVDIGGVSAVVMNNVPPKPANYLQRAGRAGRRLEAQSLAFTICSPNPIGMNAMVDPMWALNHPIAPPLLSFRSEMVVERHINAFLLGKFVQSEAINGLNVKMITSVFFFNEPIAIAAQFMGWLMSKDVNGYEVALRNIVRDTSCATKNFSFLLNRTIVNFQKLIAKTADKKIGFDEKLEALSIQFGDSSPAYKTVSYQRNQFFSKNAIGYLAEQGFLPSAGLPTGIVEFDTVTIEDLKKNKPKNSLPSYFITKALSEFAPGSQVVIDGKSYISEGIILESNRGVHAEREIIQSCKQCGYQRIIEIAKNEDIHSHCPHCHQDAFTGINFKDPDIRGRFTEMIQPAGFAVDIYHKPTRKISPISSAHYVDPLLINIKPWQNESTALFDARESEGNAEILFYNIGKGNGYSICLHCGRAAYDRTLLNGHKRLRGGKNNDNEKNSLCTGNDATHAIHEHVILGGRFKTDFCEVRFKDENNTYSKDSVLLYTLGALLSKELSHFLGVEESEIDFGIKQYEHFSTVFIFDTVKGGSGYSSQFVLHADKIFELSKKRLDSCDCDRACTKCLIDRKTQWHIDKLDRRNALAWLQRSADLKVPDEFLVNYPNLKPVLGGIKDELGRLNYANMISEIWLYGSSNIQSWDLERLPIITKLRDRIKINFIVDNDNRSNRVQDKITLIQLSAWSKILHRSPFPTEALKTLCKIRTHEGEVIEYLAAKFEEAFDENWGNASEGIIYKHLNADFENLAESKIEIDEQSVFEILIDENNPIPSDQVAVLLLDKIKGKVDLKALMHKQSFAVKYVDRYLKTPMGCALMVQFIQKLSSKLDFLIDELIFEGQDFVEDRSPRLLFHNFQNADDRNDAVIRFARDLGIPNSQAINGHLPHFRYFEFISKNAKIIIRPDAGVEHGWFLNDTANKQFTGNTNARDSFLITKKDKNKQLLYTISIEKNYASPI